MSALFFLAFHLAEAFERPLQVNRKDELSCYRYPRFTIKEIQTDEIGNHISLLPKNEKCALTHSPHEVKLGQAYLMGVSGIYIVLESGQDDWFVIFDSRTGKKLFSDSGRQLNLEKGSLNYLRALEVDCSLPLEGEACWKKIKSATTIDGDFTELKNKCTKAFKKYDEDLVKARCQSSLDKDCLKKESVEVSKYSFKNYTRVLYPVKVDSFIKLNIQQIGREIDCEAIP